MPSLRRYEDLRISGDSGGSIKIVDYIAEGGQGEVYKVQHDDGIFALKWYKRPVPSRAFRDNLARNVARGAPDSRFLWPKLLTEVKHGSFGYVMDIRPAEYAEFGDFLLNRARFKSWGTMILAAMNIVESFRLLHSQGYSYQDLNEGGFFMNPMNGDALICDNDNVAPFGENLGVKGMPGYMAPEVVTNKNRPNTNSDRFSLAIILFRLFYIDHPLEGRFTIQYPLTDSIGAQIYGEKPLFIYNPDNERNRPHPEAHANVIQRWPLFPPDLAAAFTTSFTDGLKDIGARLTEHQWMEVLIKVRGMLVRHNGKERFVNAYSRSALPEGVFTLTMPDYVVALGPNTVLYRCHVDKTSVDRETKCGIIRESMLNRGVLGLGNMTDSAWTVIEPGGGQAVLTPNSFVTIKPGLKIDFGGTIGTVE